jgi:hypothetical protein
MNELHQIRKDILSLDNRLQTLDSRVKHLKRMVVNKQIPKEAHCSHCDLISDAFYIYIDGTVTCKKCVSEFTK